jgi:iron complex outermembrane recepter protein
MRVRVIALACSALSAVTAAYAKENDARQSDIVVTANLLPSGAATKTDTPAVETPQPVTIVTDAVFLAQGAVSVSDTLRYVAGVEANPYGPDSRVDGGFVRGLNPLQFRDGMRDLFSYYASIRSDPFNFSQVEVVRGPASVLFGAGALGGIVNLVSKTPQFKTGGEVAIRYGSFERKEALADFTGPLTSTLAARIVARVRQADTQTDNVPDDRIMVAPSLSFAPGKDTRITLIGLYQEDDGGSTSQFLPLVGTILPNSNGQLPNSLFIGKPGWDRYDGRLTQGTAMADHRFSDHVQLNLKARFIDSDLVYFTHYPDNYANPANPFVLLDPATGQPVTDTNGVPLRDPEQRHIGLYTDASVADMEIFSTDNNLRLDFNTGGAIAHVLLLGVDYSWNRVRKTGTYGYEYFDVYDIDYDALSDYGGGLPPGAVPTDDTRQTQLGIYAQDQIRIHDRASVVLGLRHDKTSTRSFGGPKVKDDGTTMRAGIIAEVSKGISPFFSYTESFEPISGSTSSGAAFVPKRGRQFEAGIKLQPLENTLITATAYHIKETNRPVSDDSTADPFDQIQIGSVTSQGFEIEGNAALPGAISLLVNYSYNEAEEDGTNRQLENVPKTNASFWATKSARLSSDMALMFGGGIRYSGANFSYGPAYPDGVRTPGRTLVDAVAELSWQRWKLSINATNLFDKRHYSACLARGDCFMGAERNVYATLSVRY